MRDRRGRVERRAACWRVAHNEGQPPAVKIRTRQAVQVLECWRTPHDEGQPRARWRYLERWILRLRELTREAVAVKEKARSMAWRVPYLS